MPRASLHLDGSSSGELFSSRPVAVAQTMHAKQKGKANTTCGGENIPGNPTGAFSLVVAIYHRQRFLEGSPAGSGSERDPGSAREPRVRAGGICAGSARDPHGTPELKLHPVAETSSRRLDFIPLPRPHPAVSGSLRSLDLIP